MLCSERVVTLICFVLIVEEAPGESHIIWKLTPDHTEICAAAACHIRRSREREGGACDQSMMESHDGGMASEGALRRPLALQRYLPPPPKTLQVCFLVAVEVVLCLLFCRKRRTRRSSTLGELRRARSSAGPSKRCLAKRKGHT